MKRILLALVVLSASAPARAQLLPPFPGRTTGLAPAMQGVVAADAAAGAHVLLPVRSTEDAKEFFDAKNGASTLQTVLVNGFEDRASIYAELVGDTFGPVRVALGSTVATAKDTQDSPAAEKALTQTFFSGGGNVVLSAVLPVVLVQPGKAGASRFVVYALPRLGVDLPGVGSQSSDFSGDLDAGLEAHAQVTSDSGTFTFFGQARGAWVAGNDAFDLGIGRARPFLYGQWTAGLLVKGTVCISVSGIAAPSAVKDRYGPVTIGVSLVPKS